MLYLILLIGQLPQELDKSSYYLQDLPEGLKVYAYSNALKVDLHGNCWLQPNTVVDSKPDRMKELEIIRNKLGWIVRVRPYLHKVDTYHVLRYPQWERNYIPHYYDMPVKAIVIVKPSGPYYVRPHVRIHVKLDSFRYGF